MGVAERLVVRDLVEKKAHAALTGAQKRLSPSVGRQLEISAFRAAMAGTTDSNAGTVVGEVGSDTGTAKVAGAADTIALLGGQRISMAPLTVLQLQRASVRPQALIGTQHVAGGSSLPTTVYGVGWATREPFAEMAMLDATGLQDPQDEVVLQAPMDELELQDPVDEAVLQAPMDES